MSGSPHSAGSVAVATSSSVVTPSSAVTSGPTARGLRVSTSSDVPPIPRRVQPDARARRTLRPRGRTSPVSGSCSGVRPSPEPSAHPAPMSSMRCVSPAGVLAARTRVTSHMRESSPSRPRPNCDVQPLAELYHLHHGERSRRPDALALQRDRTQLIPPAGKRRLREPPRAPPALVARQDSLAPPRAGRAGGGTRRAGQRDQASRAA